MTLADEMIAYDQRQLKLMLQRLKFCKSKKVSEDVSNDLIGLCNILNHVDSCWKEQFLLLSTKLDHIYDIAAYEGRKNLTIEEQKETKKLINKLTKLVEQLIVDEYNL